MHIRLRSLAPVLLLLTAPCRAGGVVQISEFSEQNSAMPSLVTLVNWNAQKGEDPQLLKDLKAITERYEPDLVLLQEARVDLLETNQMGGYLAEGWRYPWPGGTTIGVMTLSKVAPVEIRLLPTKYREFFVTAPKVSLITEHRLSNRESLLAVNVHLLAFERWGTLKLSSQLDEIRSVMTQHSGPVVLVGDFSTWNE